LKQEAENCFRPFPCFFSFISECATGFSPTSHRLSCNRARPIPCQPIVVMQQIFRQPWETSSWQRSPEAVYMKNRENWAAV